MANEPVRTVWRVEWKGDEVNKLIDQAIPLGMDDTTAAAAIQSKQSHPGWKNVTGTAEGSIRGEPASKQGEVWRAYFGSFDVDYFIWLEIGARGRAGDHTLRRGADIEFPKLGERIHTHAKQLGAVDT